MSIDRPHPVARPDRGDAATFDLTALAEALRGESAYTQSGKAALTLARAPELTVVLTAVRAGTTIQEHTAPASATLTVLSGTIEFTGTAAPSRLSAGHAIVFPGGLPHAVKGIEDAAFLLVIGARPAETENES